MCLWRLKWHFKPKKMVFSELLPSGFWALAQCRHEIKLKTLTKSEQSCILHVHKLVSAFLLDVAQRQSAPSPHTILVPLNRSSKT